MSVFVDQFGDFFDYLMVVNVYLGEVCEVLGECYVCCYYFVVYLQQCLQEVVVVSLVQLQVIVQLVLGLQLDDYGYWLLLGDGQMLYVVQVVLVIGNSMCLLLVVGVEVLFVDDVIEVWDYDGVCILVGEYVVVIVGFGLSMVDIVLVLVVVGYIGLLYVILCYGLLLLLYVYGGLFMFDLVMLLLMNLCQCLYVLCGFVWQVQVDGLLWQGVMDCICLYGQVLWCSFDVVDQCCFLCYVVCYWDVYCYCIVEEVDVQLQVLIESG